MGSTLERQITRRDLLKIGAYSGVAATLAAACGGATPAASSVPTTVASAAAATVAPTATPNKFDALIRAAQAEGTLTWYSGVPPPAAVPLHEAFTKKYGIKVVLNRQVSATLGTLLKAEVESKKIIVDVIEMSDFTIMKDAAEKGWLLNPTAEEVPSLATWPAKWAYRASGAGATFMQSVGVYTLAYNKKLVGNSPPNEWKALIDPRFKGLIILNDPRSSTGSLAWMTELYKLYGTEFLQAFGKQSLQFTASTATGINSVASGDAAIMAPSARWNNTDLIAKGAPIDDAYPKPALGGAEQWAGMVKNAPHPSAAALFFNYIMSPEGMTAECTDVCSTPLNAPRTIPFPADYVSLDLPAAAKTRDVVLKALGIG